MSSDKGTHRRAGLVIGLSVSIAAWLALYFILCR